MKVRYYPEDDLMVLKLSERPYDYAEKVGSFIIHYTKDKEPVILEILKASQFLRETTEALPYSTLNKILHLQAV
jgi:uncharacterized protein YuzE